MCIRDSRDAEEIRIEIVQVILCGKWDFLQIFQLFNFLNVNILLSEKPLVVRRFFVEINEKLPQFFLLETPDIFWAFVLYFWPEIQIRILSKGKGLN